MTDRNITIQGVEFSVTAPYLAGHAITEAEAKALNQTRAENIRNNCAKQIKDAKAEHGDELPADVLASLAGIITDYDVAYVFTLASVGGGRTSRDPVEVEALRIARAAVVGRLKELGKKVADVDKDALAAKVAEIAATDRVMKAASEAVAARSKLAGKALDNLDL